MQRQTEAKQSNSKHIYRSMNGKVDLEIENEGGGFNLPMIQNSMQFPDRVAKFVIRNIAPSANRSCSSGLNGSDLEQMSHSQVKRLSLETIDIWNKISDGRPA